MKKNEILIAQILSASLIFLVSAASLNACSAKISNTSSEETIPLGHSDFQDLVAGPNLEGSWKSGCIADWRTDHQWEMIALTFKDKNVTRHADLFSDSDCSSPLDTSRDQHGLYRFGSVGADGSFIVEYRFKPADGADLQTENYKISGDTLLIDDEISGDVEPSIVISQDIPSVAITPVPSP